ncbi:MAG TPA: enoyl-CoA hydratase/isomerase family protein [Candidatus Acidoferrales bacterium]|nr:enoyl-CoA hydratase/isomerase family protein [Candidatus Acidoferrales bacterium]
MSPTTTASFLRIESSERVARVMIDRPPLNILNIDMVAEIGEALVRLPAQHEFIIFRGAGGCFSAGADVADHTPERVGRLLGAFHHVFHEMGAGHAVTIAAVEGRCLGGGCELAMCCDFILAEESATFGFPEIKLGCFPPIAMVALPRMMPGHAAFDLILTGKTISAQEASGLGMATRVVPHGELTQAVDGLLAEMKHLSPPILRLTRRLTRTAGFKDEEKELTEIENLYLDELIRTHDAVEGVRAFLEKRPPVWTGR